MENAPTPVAPSSGIERVVSVAGSKTLTPDPVAHASRSPDGVITTPLGAAAGSSGALSAR
jgi:hypothetical protein